MTLEEKTNESHIEKHANKYLVSVCGIILGFFSLLISTKFIETEPNVYWNGGSRIDGANYCITGIPKELYRNSLKTNLNECQFVIMPDSVNAHETGEELLVLPSYSDLYKNDMTYPINILQKEITDGDSETVTVMGQIKRREYINGRTYAFIMADYVLVEGQAFEWKK
jgi:hypothetical protein